MNPFVMAAAAVLTLASVSMATIKTQEIEYKDGDVVLGGYYAYDEVAAAKGKLAAVLVTPEWWGHNAYARKRAEMLAELGYAAFALDMYGKDVLAETPEAASKLAGPFYGPDPKTGVRTAMRQRAAAGLKVLVSQPQVDASRVAAIGYCMGGTVSLELARSGVDVKAVVSFHGGLSTPKPEDAKAIKGQVLVCHGADDPMVDAAEVAAFKQAMDSAKVRYVFVAYPGAVHAFTNPEAGKGATAGMKGVMYNEEADEKSWAEMKAFFEKTLK